MDVFQLEKNKFQQMEERKTEHENEMKNMPSFQNMEKEQHSEQHSVVNVSQEVNLNKEVKNSLITDSNENVELKKEINELVQANKSSIVEPISSERVLNLKKEEVKEAEKQSRVEQIESQWQEIFESANANDTYFDTPENYQKLLDLKSQCNKVVRFTHLFCFGNAQKKAEKAKVKTILEGINKMLPQATEIRKRNTYVKKTSVGQFFKNVASKAWNGLKSVGRELAGPITSISVREFTREKGLASKIKGLFAVPARFLGTVVLTYGLGTIYNVIAAAANVAYFAVRPLVRGAVGLVDGIRASVKGESTFKEAWKNGKASKLKRNLPLYSYREFQSRWDSKLGPKLSIAEYHYYKQLRKEQENKLRENDQENQDKKDDTYIYNDATVNTTYVKDVTSNNYPEWTNVVGWGKLLWNKISGVGSNFNDKSAIQERMEQEKKSMSQDDDDDMDEEPDQEYVDAMKQAGNIVGGPAPAMT